MAVCLKDTMGHRVRFTFVLENPLLSIYTYGWTTRLTFSMGIEQHRDIYVPAPEPKKQIRFWLAENLAF